MTIFSSDLDFSIPRLYGERPHVLVGMLPGQTNLESALREAFLSYRRPFVIGLTDPGFQPGAQFFGDPYAGIVHDDVQPEPDVNRAVVLMAYGDAAERDQPTIGLAIRGMPRSTELWTQHINFAPGPYGSYGIGSPSGRRVGVLRVADANLVKHPENSSWNGLGVFSHVRLYGAALHMESVQSVAAPKEHVLYGPDNGDFVILKDVSGLAGGRTFGQWMSRQSMSPPPPTWLGIHISDFDCRGFDDGSYDGSLLTLNYPGRVVIENSTLRGSPLYQGGGIAAWAPANLGGPYLWNDRWPTAYLAMRNVRIELPGPKTDDVSIGGVAECHMRGIDLSGSGGKFISAPGMYSGDENGRVLYHLQAGETVPAFRAYLPGEKYGWTDPVEDGRVVIVPPRRQEREAT